MTTERQGPIDAAQRCHYAANPATRPCCTVNATVRYGTIALCPSCNARRSSIGKGQRAVALSPGQPYSVLDWISTAHEQTAAAERNLAAVTRARQTGTPWSAIGTQLGITRQAAQQRFMRASAHESTKQATRAH